MRVLLALTIIFIFFTLAVNGQGDLHINKSDSLKVQTDSLEKEPFLLAMNLGAFSAFNPKKIQGMYEIEFYPSWKAWFFYPFAGAFVTTHTSACIYAGITIPIKVKKRLLVRISFAPGLYTSMDKKANLGYLLEFRSSLKLAYIFKNQGRLGIQFSHISNANLNERNPGSEILVISYEIPLRIKSKQ